VHGKTLAHLSDLHFGSGIRNERAAAQLSRALLETDVDHVVVTGDVTHRGRLSELQRFYGIFEPLFARGKITLVPGNHDRLGDDVGSGLNSGKRVDVQIVDGLYLIRFDSTGPHNRSLVAGHGFIDQNCLDELRDALMQAPAGHLCVLLMHHHPLPLPQENLPEWLLGLFGWPFSLELSLGETLLRQAVGHCDLVLHGHRHIPREICFARSPRPLHVYNAGSSTELRRFRAFQHLDGKLLGSPTWFDLRQRPLASDARRPLRIRPAAVGETSV
jgi:3',5'-cyclic AMP phosphodiesterase CpdA